jgi:hypothetical protein
MISIGGILGANARYLLANGATQRFGAAFPVSGRDFNLLLVDACSVVGPEAQDNNLSSGRPRAHSTAQFEWC